MTSWRASVSGRAASWRDDFRWPGTPNHAPFLAIPAAIRLLEAHGLQQFRDEAAALAREAVRRIEQITGLPPVSPDFGLPMAAAALPDPPGGPRPVDHGDVDPLQAALRDRHAVEAPVIVVDGQRRLRASGHLYVKGEHVDRLVNGVTEELARGL